MKIRPFEIALLVFFGILAVGALILLNTGSSSGPAPDDPEFVGPVQIWGTLPEQPVNDVLETITRANDNFSGVTYRSFSIEDFNQNLIESLADSQGPDLILVSQEHLVEQRARIRAIPYEGISRRDFQDRYLDGASLFALSDGIYGTPIVADPLMMYWNKDILTNNGFLTAPATWEELVNIQLPVLVDRSADRTINQAVVAMGSYDNVQHGFGMLSTLLIQSGSAMVNEKMQGGSVSYDVLLNETASDEARPFEDGLSFYLRFSQPTNAFYSWNRAFQADRTEFISGDLVFYFGYGSEGYELEELNPNLNFDIAEMPQSSGAKLRRTYGRFYGLSPLRTSDNVVGATKVISALGQESSIAAFAQNLNMVPAFRPLAAQGSNDLYGRTTYRSAVVARGWLNPDPVVSDQVFSSAVRDVNENRASVPGAVTNTERDISRLYK